MPPIFFNLSSILLSAACAFPLMAMASIEIELDQPKQQIVMMGADMERSANALQHAKNTREIVRWVFEDTEGVDYMRVAFDKNQELVRGQKNMSFYKLQLRSMQQIKSVRPDVRFWATPRTDYDGYGTSNNLPDWIYHGQGYDGGRYDPDRLEVDYFAQFLADYLEFMDVNGVPIYCLSPMKEWSQVISPAKTTEVIVALRRECRFRRIKIPIIIGPASWSVSGGIRDLQKIQSLGGADDYAGFATHQYQSASEVDMRKFVELATAMGKRAFDDETNTGGGGRSNGVEPEMEQPVRAYLRRASNYRAGLSGEVFFENWSRGINSETRSIYFKRGGVARRMRAYWLFKEFTGGTMLSHYIPSHLRMRTDAIDTMAFRKGDLLTLWVMNQSKLEFGRLEVLLKGGERQLKPEASLIRWSESTDIRGERSEVQVESPDKLTIQVPPVSINKISLRLKSDLSLKLSPR